jgi:hypothetical protein
MRIAAYFEFGSSHHQHFLFSYFPSMVSVSRMTAKEARRFNFLRPWPPPPRHHPYRRLFQMLYRPLLNLEQQPFRSASDFLNS